jgi:hypothetical protein
MPPKAQADVLRGRGRPKRSAAPEPTSIVDDAPKKRGRAAKVDAVEVEVRAAAEAPKKRGRPSKAHVEEPIVVAEPPKRGRRTPLAPEPPIEEVEAPKKRMGRPRKVEVADAPVPVAKKRAGRPAKADVAVEEAPITPRRRGRPFKNAALDLDCVAGSSRVTKRTSPRSKSNTKATTAAPAPRLNPRMRSKLRNRLPPAQKMVSEQPIAQPAKRRGRPAKAAPAVPTPTKGRGRKHTQKAVSEPIKSAITKPSAPRKKRGITLLEVPDKFAAQLKQYLQDLQDAESLPTPVDQEDEEDTKAQAGADEETQVEDDLDPIGEEGVEDPAITNGIAGDEDNGLLTSEQDQEVQYLDDHADNDIGPDVPDTDMTEEVVEQVIIREEIQDPVSGASGVEVVTTVQEVLQVEQINDGLDSYMQEDDEDLDAQVDARPSTFDEDDDENDAILREIGARPSAGAIFG